MIMSGKISCKQAVHFISKKEEGKLAASQRFALWCHLNGCSLCRIFSVQNRLIRRAISQQETRALDPAEKDAIIKSVLESTR